MFMAFDLSTNPNVIIGSLVMYIILFLLWIYAYKIRSSINRNASFYYTMTVAIFGILNSAILISTISLALEGYSVRIETLLSGLFFGLTLTPLTWMVGITLFSGLGKEKRPTLVIYGYFFSFVQFVLAVFVTLYIYVAVDSLETEKFSITYISSVSINWVFFLIFVRLVIQYRRSVPQNIMRTLIVFGILNTARLTTETVFLVGTGLSLSTYLYILFFFTDFVSVLSLYMSTLLWKDIPSPEEKLEA